MTKPALIHRLRTAVDQRRGIMLAGVELARVYVATRAALGAQNEFVERMRVAVLDKATLRLTIDETTAALERLDKAG